MHDHGSSGPMWMMLSILGPIYAGVAYAMRNKPRPPQEGLSKELSIGFLLLPSLIALACSAISTFTWLRPKVPLWLTVFLVLVLITAELSRRSAEWIGVPRKVREASNQIGWGVILCVAVMAVATTLSEALGL